VLYRFTHAATDGDIRADVAEVTAAMPPTAVTGAASWLAAENSADGNGAIMEPFVIAFALIELAMAVLIVGNVVSGAVVAGYQRIGVLKSVGWPSSSTRCAGWPRAAPRSTPRWSPSCNPEHGRPGRLRDGPPLGRHGAPGPRRPPPGSGSGA
jgi:hypothetical protein